MEIRQEFSRPFGDHSLEWVKGLEKAGLAVAENLGRIVNTVEAIAISVSKFFDTVKKQKETVVELGHSAGAKIKPVAENGMKILSGSRAMGGRLVTKSRENPLPFVIGGIAIVGGIALLAYYIREEEGTAGSSRETFAA